MTDGNKFHFLAEGHCTLDIPAECGPPATRVQECNPCSHFVVTEIHVTQAPAADGGPAGSAPSSGTPGHGRY